MASNTQLLQSPSLVHILKQRAQIHPERQAFVFLANRGSSATIFSFADLDQEARRIARFLAAHCHRGDRVILLYPAEASYIAAFMGCLYAGVIAVPLYPPRQNRRLARVKAIFSSCGARLALTSERIFDQIQQALHKSTDLGHVSLYATSNLACDPASDSELPDPRTDDIAFLQYTSGSTGSPKGVIVSHDNLMANERVIAELMQINYEDKFASWLPLYHDMGLIGNTLQPLFSGIPSVQMSFVSFIQSPMRWLKAISDYGCTISGAPNFAYDFCVERIRADLVPSLDLSRWRIAFNGAEPVRASTLKRFSEAFAPAGFRETAMFPCYGMAEATLAVSGSYPGQGYRESQQSPNPILDHLSQPYRAEHTPTAVVSSGRIPSDHKVVIVHPESRQLLDDGQVGEIWIHGPSVAQGYWQCPELSKAVFEATIHSGDQKPYLRSGDLGFLENNQLFVTGRLKEVIIVDGRNHYPQDLEAVATACHPSLKPNSAAAFAIEAEGREQVVLVLEDARRKQSGAEDEIFAAILQAVSDAYQLSLHTMVLIKRNTLMKTSSGKIQRLAMRQAFLGGDLHERARWERHRPDPVNVNPQPAQGNQAPVETAEVLQNLLIKLTATCLGMRPEQLDAQQPLAQYGLTSTMAISISGQLAQELERDVPATLFYDYPTIAKMAGFLVHGRRKTITHPPQKTSPSAKVQEPIALLGIGCRFPGADGPEAFWRLIRDGVDAISDLPSQRRALLGVPPNQGDQPLWGGYLSDIECFDAAFFGMSPLEAEVTDPQQRLVLEVAYQALNHAGIAPSSLAGSRTGIFLGLATHDYERLLQADEGNAFLPTGNAASIAANRLSYCLDLQGPSMAVDTACSSSLVALHQACRALEAGDCDLALAGGVNVLLDPEITAMMAKSYVMAPDGHCKAFDADADGYVRSEGCGMVVLRRLTDAVDRTEPTLAIIRGTAVNQDGRSNGLKAPNGLAQESVINQALTNAGIPAQSVTYVEAHGTGTALGDPIEVKAIQETYGRDRPPNKPMAIGSVKTNVGHMEAAAGIGGFIKTVLAMNHATIPKNLLLSRLNPRIDLGTLYYVPRTNQCWDSDGAVRRAGVSSFGFGGTNAHIIVEQSPQFQDVKEAKGSVPVHFLPLSAKSEIALKQLKAGFADYLQQHPQVDLGALCHTASSGRDHFPKRAAYCARTREGLIEQLQAVRHRPQVETTQTIGKRGYKQPRIAFVFAGAGGQYRNMGRQLFTTQPVFRQAVLRCDALIKDYLGFSLIPILYPDCPEEDSRLHEIMYSQVALFTLQYALTEMLAAWQIRPCSVIGHSAGEYAAACCAGVFSLEDGLRLVSERGRLMQSTAPGGAMATVFSDTASLASHLRDFPKITIAALNAPQNTVLSGPEASMNQLMNRLQNANIRCRLLKISVASHGPLMDGILDEFTSFAGKIDYQQPKLPLFSNLSGQRLTHAPDPIYWRRHLRGTVCFAEGLAQLHQQGCDLLLEIGPRQVMTNLCTEVLAGEVPAFPCLKANEDDWDVLGHSLTQLYQAGAAIDWHQFHDRSLGCRLIGLPGYPFQRKRYWYCEPGQFREPAHSFPTPTSAPVTTSSNHLEVPMQNETSQASPDQLQAILSSLQSILARLLKMDSATVDIHQPLLELGADSLVLMDALRDIQSQFGVKVAIRQVFEELPTLEALAYFIRDSMPTRTAAGQPPEPAGIGSELVSKSAPIGAQLPQNPAGNDRSPLPFANSTDLPNGHAPYIAQLVDQQSRLVAMALGALSGQTLETNATPPASPPNKIYTSPSVSAATIVETPQRPKQITVHVGDPSKRSYTAFGPYNPVTAASLTKSNLSDRQQQHLSEFVAAYTENTAQSKKLTQEYRRELADNRASAGFRFSTKEMVYPIAAKRLSGSHFWDLDDNRYVDIAMGFGVNLLGHNPLPMVQATSEHLRNDGLEMGPRSRFAGEVARLVTELTGTDRAAFCCSGTEAVMTAVRLARLATGRAKIAIFKTSYHGHFDAVLARPSHIASEGTIPMAPGIPDSLVKDTLILEYGSFEDLEKLRACSNELAAVLVEPVQSRRPELQPGAFLKALREETEALGILLIFDEMVTGFRIAQGGAQAYFGVRADLVTYGKVLGGGLPIGCIAGKAAFMDGIDGGYWQYGDRSFPQVETTFLAGTYQMHSLSMVSAHAVLSHLKQQGPGLQKDLNERTATMAKRLRDVVSFYQAPIRIAQFSSFFRFHLDTNLDLFFYLLLHKGVYTWEGRTCFLSTAHSDEDIDHIVGAVEETLFELRSLGYFGEISQGEIGRFVETQAPNRTRTNEQPIEVGLGK